MNLRQQVLPAWLLLGDFNLIYRAQDKNNSGINLSMLNNFKYTIDNLELAPIDLQGKKYTWCNDQQMPTMTKIDHMFASTDWLEIFPRTHLQALASLGSDPYFYKGMLHWNCIEVSDLRRTRQKCLVSSRWSKKLGIQW